MEAPETYAAGPAGEEAPVHLREYWETLWRRRNLFLSVLVLVLVTGLGVTLTTRPLYQASATLQIERDTSGALTSQDVFYSDYLSAETLQTQIALLKSRALGERVVKALRLAESADFGDPASARRAPRQAAEGARQLAQLNGRIAEGVMGGLTVEPVRGTHVVRLSYVAGNPDQAVELVNAIAEQFVEWNVENKYRTVGQASAFLLGQVETLKQEVLQKESLLQQYGREKDIVSTDPSNIQQQKLESLSKDYTEAMADRIQKEARFRELANAPPETLADTIAGGLVSQLRGEQLKLERDYATKLNVYKPEWPAMRTLKAQIEKGRQHLDQVVADTVEKARQVASTEYATALSREKKLKEVLDQQKRETIAMSSSAAEYNNIKLEASAKRGLLDALLKRQSESEIEARLKGTKDPNVRIVDRALLPPSPFRPSYTRNGLLALVLGGFLGLGAVFFAEYLDRSVKSAEDVERWIGVPTLGIIPAAGSPSAQEAAYRKVYGRLRRRKAEDRSTTEETGAVELICDTRPRSAIAEAYRVFRTAVLLSTADELRAIVITSAQPREGKTTTAANLGVVLAQLGKKVLLVDADLRKPRLHEIFRVSNQNGLANYLSRGCGAAEVIVEGLLPAGLSLVPSGPVPPNPSELLASDRMQELLVLARQRFDFIVIDSPPSLPVTDATILGRRADGTVLCVKGGGTPREHVARARDRILQAGGGKLLGVLLNNLEPAHLSYYAGRYDGAYEPYYAERPAGES